MKLWSGVLSPFSAKVRIALAEKGLSAEICEVPWTRKTLWNPKPPELLKLNPRGQVPVLVDDDGTVVCDSTVILEYLEERHPRPPLLPRDPAERARCRWLENEADDCMARHVTPLVREVFVKLDPAERDAAVVAEATKGLRDYYTLLERELEGREHLCDRFSVADIATFQVLGFASTLGVAPGEGEPKLRAWFERVGARPTVRAELEAMTRAAARA